MGAFVCRPEARPVAPPRSRAEALHAEGLERLARGQVESATVAFNAALAVDPGFAPALLDRGIWDRLATASLAAWRAARDDPEHPLRACGAAALFYTLNEPGGRPLLDRDAVACDRLSRYLRQHAVLTQPERLRLLQSACDAWPESAFLFTLLVSELVEGRRFEALRATAAAGERRSAVHRLLADDAEAVALHALGRHGEALAREATTRKPPDSPGTAIVRVAMAPYHLSLQHDSLPVALRAHVDSSAARYRQVLMSWRAAPSPAMRFELGMSWLRTTLDGGRLTEAMAIADSLVALADSTGSRMARAEAVLLRGRAAVKAGQTGLAERELAEAGMLARSEGAPRVGWEVQHNLLHLYESTGRDAQALAAGLAFARLTEAVPLRAERMMSYHDLGMFLRARGEWADAQRWFERMVATVDSLGNGQNDFYAGEYFESVGRLEDAMRYYLRGSDVHAGDRSLAALARVAELLGDTTAALRYAAGHDGFTDQRYPEGRPLLPGLLARMGRWPEAGSGLLSARRIAAGRGQRAAWGRLTMELAEVELALANPGYAMSLADSALSALIDPAERDFAMRAEGIGALAAARVGDASAAARLRRLAGSRRRAAQAGGVVLAAELGVMEGDAHRALGGFDAALAAYRRAQEVVDTLAGALSDDATRVSIRAAQRKASTRALEVLLARRHRGGATSAWLAWSERRKARTVALGGAPAAQPAMAEPGTALLDYVVLDSTVAVLVQSGGRSSIHDLEVRPSEVEAWLQRLYARAAPRVGSLVDATRAGLDTAATAWLSGALVAPLLDELAGVERVTIVPDGPLFLVPFDVLPLRAGGLVAERFTVSLSPSPRLAGSAGAGRDGRPALVVAGVLTEAAAPSGLAAEAQRVRAAIRGREVRLLEGRGATESAVREGMVGAGLVHLASHAVPNVSRPDFAEVRLAPDGMHDGRLQAFEVRRLDLRGTIVVLSACETGSGRVAGGEGPVSLARAFLQAGARVVVATLWPVLDTPGDLMADFHARLDAGAEPARALRDARLAALRRGDDLLTIAPWVIVGASR